MSLDASSTVAPSEAKATPAASNGRSPSLSDAEKASVEAPAQERNITGFKWFVFIASTLTAIFIYAMDNTITADIVPAIVNDLGEAEKLPWLSVGFTIGGIALILPFGKLYALFDNKIIFMSSTLLFLVGSAVCGAAPTMNAEIVGRVLAGIGGNGMYLGLLTIISAQCTDRERPAYLGLTGLSWGTGTVLGPVIGGGFELYTWRWAFYINLVLGAVLVLCYLFVIPSTDPSEGRTVKQRLGMIDWLGALLSCCGFTFLTMAINFGGAIYPWRSAAVIVLFILAGLAWIAFTFQQSFNFLTTKEQRMFPMHLFGNRQVLLLFVCGCIGGFFCILPVYYIPLYFQFTRGDSAILAAVRLLPDVCVLVFFIVGTGLILNRVGYFKPFFVAGSSLNIIGSVLMSRVDVTTDVAQVYGWQIMLGAGTGLFVQLPLSVVQVIVEAQDIGYGLTLMLVAQLSGISFGLSVAGALFINFAISGLQDLFPGYPEEQIHQAVSGTSNGFLDSLTVEMRDRALGVIVGAIQNTYILGYATGAICFICALLLRNGKIRK